MNGVRVQSPLKSWIFSGFFTQLHKLRSLRRSFLHFQLNDWCISVVAVPVGWSALPKMWQSNLWSSSIDTLLYKSSETDRPSEPCLWRRLSVTCRATKKIKFHRYADMRRTLQWFDTQGITDMKKGESGRKLRKGTQKHVNEFVTNLPPKH